MFGFGNSKKNEAKASGGFGLPGLSLGGAEKSLGQGIGQASNKLKNTGKKVEDFLFGHSGSQKVSDESSAKNEAKASGSFGLPGLSLGKAKTTLGQGVGEASDTLKNTGKKVEDLLFGHSGSKKKINELSTKNRAETSGGLSLGLGLGQASDTLKNTGKKVENLLFGQSGSQKYNELSIKNETKLGGGLGLPDLSLGKAENAVGQGLGQASDTLQKTGKKVEDLLFGHSGSHKDKDELSTRNKTKLGGGLGLPDLSFGKAEKAVGQTLGQASDTLKNTGKKVEDLLFGNTGNKTSTNELSIGIPGIGVGSLNIKENTLNATFGLNQNAPITPHKSTQVPKFSSTSSFFETSGLPSVSDVGKKVKDDIAKIGNKVEKTGTKVVDYIFGSGNSTATSADPNLFDGNKTAKNVPGGFDTEAENSTLKIAPQPGINLNGNIGLNGSSVDVNTNVLQTPRTTIISHSPSGSNTTSPESLAVSKNVHDGLAKVEGATEEAVTEKTSLNGSFNEDTNGSEHLGVSKLPTPNTSSLDDMTETTILVMNTKGQNEDKFRNKTNETITTARTTSQELAGLLGRNEKTEVVIPSPPPNLLASTDDRDNATFEASESPNTKIFGTDDFSDTNSSDGSEAGLFGVSEVPLNLSTKSEETLKKIEDILQGSGTSATISAVETDVTIPSKDKIPSEKPNSILNQPPTSNKFTYTNEVTNEDSLTLKPTTNFETSIIEVGKTTTPQTNDSNPAILPPFIVVSNKSSTIGDQNTPRLPPTVFDKPTGERAPFIPILPPPMESSTGGLIASTASKIPHTLAPHAMTPTSGSLTPVEYGAIGVGSVLIIALIAYIYQKYKQYITSSTGGSYSPMTQHRNAPGRKKSSRSNNSEGGYSTNEADGATGIEMNAINSEVVVVELATEVKTVEEVVETPIIKTTVNGLQKSSTAEHHDMKQSSSSTPDTIEVISEIHKPKSMGKPPRKSKTPISSPGKFTSDKTSASNLNEDSLKTVTHAIGGILKSQVPNETENQTCGQQSNDEDSSEDPDEKGVSLIGKLEGLVFTDPTGNNDQNINSEDVEIEDNTPEQDATSDGEPLYKSLEKEVDAGSEYFSADEHSDARNSPPRSPILNKGFEDIPTRNLRAEDVYNTEIITEDGRRRSIEEDIAESIEEKKDAQYSSDTVEEISPSNEDELEGCSDNSTLPSAPLLSQVICSEYTNTENDCSKSGTDKNEIPKEIHMKNLINTEKTNNQHHVKEEAEMIIDEILKTSQLDALTIQSIKQDLGDSESGKQRVKWSNNIENISYLPSIINNGTQDQPKKKVSCDLDSFTWRELPTDKTKDETLDLESSRQGNEIVMIQESSSMNILEDSSNLMEEDSRNSQLVYAEDSLENDHKTSFEEDAFAASPDEVNARIFDADSLSEENSSYYAQNIHSPNPSPSSTNEESMTTDQNMDSIDEGFPMEHRFEFIPPRQPQIFEDDMIVFSNSDQESISPLSNSTAEFNVANEEHLIAMSNDNDELNIDPTNANNDLPKEIIQTVEENVRNRTKWYVPDDEISELDLKTEAEKPGEGLFIVLSEEEPKLAPVENVVPPTSERNVSESPRTPKKEIKNFSNISYAFIEVNDDPRNEVWPDHLPKNIHSISGVGLVKTAENAPLLHNPLKEEEPEVIPSTSGYQNVITTQDSQPLASTETSTQKPIPKFIIPNMDGRLTRKKASRRRQIKSLDSGVHHYYGEYLSLAELPEIDHENEKNEVEVKQETGVVEDVLTIKPDGTITQETIVIPNSN